MGRPRQNIIYPGALAHVTWRTNNKEFFLADSVVKQFIYDTLVKYKKKYDIKIFDWVEMSNHIHFSAYIDDPEMFSRFMQAANSVIAKFINKRLNRSGCAIADRYKSPVIEDEKYLVNTIEYIWLNPAKANLVEVKGSADYQWCSLYRRSRGLPDPLVTSYAELKELIGVDILEGYRNEQDFVKRLFDRIIKVNSELDPRLFEHLHSIGSKEFRKARRHRFDLNSNTAIPIDTIGPAPPAI